MTNRSVIQFESITTSNQRSIDRKGPWIPASNKNNLDNEIQAEDRCHRVGQTRPVHIIRLVSQGNNYI